MQMPLEGIRVLDISRAQFGPYAGVMLADMGADVIKVEPKTGDFTRNVFLTSWYPPGTIDAYILAHNRGKRSLCLDVKAPGGRTLFERLVATADVLLNNYSPRGVRSLGIDCETLRAVNPDIISIDMSGFGATGPGAEQVSFGPVLDATSGLAHATGICKMRFNEKEEIPLVCHLKWIDSPTENRSQLIVVAQGYRGKVPTLVSIAAELPPFSAIR